MKKIFILSFLFLSFFAFGETENSLKSDNLLAGSNIITADLTKVQAGAEAAAATNAAPTNAVLRIFLGVGFDLLVGLGESKKTEESKRSSEFGPDYHYDHYDHYLLANDYSSQNFYETPLLGTTHFIVGTRIFNLLDVFGRVGLNYGHILKEVTNSSHASLGNLGLFADVNVRGNLFITDTFGFYAHAGAGLNYDFKKFMNSFSKDSPTSFSFESSQVSNASKKAEMQFFGNAGIGLAFRIGKNEGLNIGYSLRYYLSSMNNTDSPENHSIIRYGDNQLMHGISFEYLFFL